MSSNIFFPIRVLFASTLPNLRSEAHEAGQLLQPRPPPPHMRQQQTMYLSYLLLSAQMELVTENTSSKDTHPSPCTPVSNFSTPGEAGFDYHVIDAIVHHQWDPAFCAQQLSAHGVEEAERSES